MLAALILVFASQHTVAGDLVDAVRSWQKLGFERPEAGIYCLAKYRVSTVTGGPAEVTGLGWALKAKRKLGKFLASNGETYDLVKVENKRNLRVDIADVYGAQWNPLSVGIPIQKLNPPAEAKSWLYPSDLFLVLAHQAGEEKAVLEAFARRQAIGSEPLLVSALKPFLSARLDRALAAHTAGNDKQAAETSKWILDHIGAIELEAKRSYKGRWEREVQSMGAYARPAVFPNLRIVPTLYADSVRRIKEHRAPFDLKSIVSLPIEVQVKVLIAHLDEVRVYQSSQPGLVVYGEDPIVARLVEIGGPSVEPLLACIENDKRLTRSVSYGRSFVPAPKLVTVKDTARSAYNTILQTFNLPEGSSPATLRAYWERTKAMTPIERQFDVLDDNNSRSRWHDAVDYLFASTGPGKAVRAEAFRNRTNPSVSDLLIKRALELSTYGQGFRMLVKLEQWDPATFSAAGRDAFQVFARNQGVGQNIQSADMARFVDAMVRHGDQEMLPRYADWLLNFKSFDPSYENALWFYPLVRYPDAPAFKGLVNKMFGNEGRFGLTKMQEQMPGWNHVEGFLSSPLLRHPDFRAIAIETLQNRRVIGETVVEKGTVYRRVDNSSTGERDESADVKAHDGTKTTYRLCDAFAITLSRNDTTTFHAYWPEDRRDAEIATVIESLKNGTFDVPKEWYGDYGPDKLK